MTVLITTAQAIGVFAVLVGVVLLLPFGAALVVDGLVVVVLATAVEHIVRGRPAPASDRRSRVEQGQVA